MGHQLSSWPQERSNPEVPGRLAVWEVAREDKNKRYIKKVSKRGAKGNASRGEIRTFEGEKQMIRK